MLVFLPSHTQPNITPYTSAVLRIPGNIYYLFCSPTMYRIHMFQSDIHRKSSNTGVKYYLLPRFVFFFFLSILQGIFYLRPSVLSLLVVTQIRGHIAGSSPPLPTTVRAFHFYRGKISALSSLEHDIYNKHIVGQFLWETENIFCVGNSLRRGGTRGRCRR